MGAIAKGGVEGVVGERQGAVGSAFVPSDMADQPNAGFSDEQCDEFRIAFDAFDDDGMGTIGREELGQLLDALGRASPTRRSTRWSRPSMPMGVERSSLESFW